MNDPVANRNQYALAALKERRALFSGELAQLESRAKAKRETLASIDVVIRLFAPEVDPDTIPNRRPRRGTVFPIDNLNRRILGILRRRGEALSTPDIVDAVMAEMGYGDEALSHVQTRVRDGLKHLAKGERAPVSKEGWRGTARWGLS